MMYTIVMATITDIKPQARNKSRVSVFVDGEFFGGMEKLTAMQYRLRVGAEVDPDRLAEAAGESERASAFERAAIYLGARPRTQKEIADYLTGKGYAPDAVDATVQKLQAYGYIDDVAFCRAYVEEYKHKAGARKMECELKAKGVSAAVIDEVLSALDEQESVRAATALAEKYLRSHAFDARKLTAFLLGKGFDYDTVRAAFEELGEDE